MNKIIIHNRTNMTDEEAMLYVNVVIRQGKISKVKDVEQYCFVTSFTGGIIVSSGRKNNTYTFYVDKEE